jgi:hypothetical protein
MRDPHSDRRLPQSQRPVGELSSRFHRCRDRVANTSAFIHSFLRRQSARKCVVLSYCFLSASTPLLWKCRILLNLPRGDRPAWDFPANRRRCDCCAAERLPRRSSQSLRSPSPRPSQVNATRSTCSSSVSPLMNAVNSWNVGSTIPSSTTLAPESSMSNSCALSIKKHTFPGEMDKVGAVIDIGKLRPLRLDRDHDAKDYRPRQQALCARSMLMWPLAIMLCGDRLLTSFKMR